MSASLVGSEMCIRDRSWCACCVRGGRRTLLAPVLSRASTRRQRSQWIIACLLYTSDAADDM
eukprot:10587583-Alexandrium_andersonii.AAC.1